MILRKHGQVNEKGAIFFLFILQISYILDFVGVSRKKPQFDHKLWNIHDCVVGAVPCFNNLIEGWLNAFASRITVDGTNTLIDPPHILI